MPFQHVEGIFPIPNISTEGRLRKQLMYLASYIRRGLVGSTISGATTTGQGAPILAGSHLFKTPIFSNEVTSDATQSWNS